MLGKNLSAMYPHEASRSTCTLQSSSGNEYMMQDAGRDTNVLDGNDDPDCGFFLNMT